MAYDEFLADRLRQGLRDLRVHFTEKQMMGGITFMVDDKMCLGIVREDLMVRIDPDFQDEALEMPGCREMDFTSRPMKGFVFVSPEGTDMDEDLDFWIDKALEFNPKAKSSKRK